MKRDLFGSVTVRRILVILLLAAAWEGYGRFLDDDLLFPTLSKTIEALFQTSVTGELPSRVGNSLMTLGMGYAAGVALAALFTTLAVSSRFGGDLLTMLTGMFSPLPAVALLASPPSCS
jgi:NitT/TauT family transport system permease protein